MKLCVYGAGAIGGILAATIARSGLAEVSVVARGAHLAAIQARGLRFQSASEIFTAPVTAIDEPTRLGPQDHVLVALKGQSIPAAADGIAALCGPMTRVTFIQNGIPWWYFHADTSPHANTRLPRLDPDGALWRKVGPERVIGAVSHHAASVPEPGVVVHTTGTRLYLGEPDGSIGPDVAALSAVLTAAGWDAPARPRIRDDIWLKLLGNVSSNPISALAEVTTDRIFDGGAVEAVVRRLMGEAKAVGEALGARIAMTIDDRIALARTLGAFKTSMLQDLEKRRTLELDALVGAVLDLGELTGVATPTIGLIHALTRQKAALLGLLAET